MGLLDKFSKKDGKERGAGKPKAAPKKEAAGKAAEPTSEAKPEVKGVGKKKSRPEASFAYSIIGHPIATEKSERQQMNGKYVFSVSRGANKVEIARAVRELYGVSPVSVRVMNIKGKKVRFGRLQGRRKDARKAIVTLKEGDSISLAE